MSKKVIVFAPHPDDETLGCGGTIAKKVREGYAVTIVVMTDGRYALSALGIGSNPTPEELKRIRKEEVIKAAATLGVREDNLTFFNFEDGSLRQKEREAGKMVEALLRRHPPVEIYFPYGKDSNVDHRAANKILVDSIKKASSPGPSYQYSIMQKYSRVGPIRDRLMNIFRGDLLITDVSEFLPLKEAAIRQFRSQTAIAFDTQQRPVITNIGRFLKNEEVFHITPPLLEPGSEATF